MKPFRFLALFFILSQILAGSALAQTGSISGKVVNGSNQGITADIYLTQLDGTIMAYSNTDSSGNYTVSGLYNGPYYVQTFGAVRLGEQYIDEVYNNIPCVAGICDRTSATQVVVTGGGAVTGKNFVLAKGGSISGTISGPGGATTATMYLYTAAGEKISFFSGDGSGNYTIGGLPSGSYRLATHNEHGLVDELYNGVNCPGLICSKTSGSTISVTAPSTTSGINFSLAQGARIEGIVYNSDASKTIDGAQVKIYSSTGTLIETRSGSFDGSYHSATGLPAGNYFVTAEKADFAPELYDNIDCAGACTATNGTAVNLTSGATATNINFTFSPLLDLTGTFLKKGFSSTAMGKLEVKNLGLQATGPFTVKIYKSETNPKAITAKIIKTVRYESLDALGVVKIKIKKKPVGPNKFLFAEIDADNEVDEADETNNTTGRKAKI